MPLYISKKRNLVLMIFGLISTTFMIQTVSAKSSKPNFVFFLVDDFGWGSISAMGHEFVETPNIDKLAKSGKAKTRIPVKYGETISWFTIPSSGLLKIVTNGETLSNKE
ncbi:Twin-arginine translocation pathway signal [Lentisphaera araneosa HTCC2155]|uniref:Twin-arginine translocation pathway signal n=1 Tax=Lentisphaera araneosa HTCC2155 TaxID=313628 RepID=A6DID3_9BACT|nr:hypothetical protein [Lentisphaera araneosa]EDM28787.1 Twin-arginine translocation pathway signal [Lentisphaera araneosa HTCC2155]